MKILVSLFFLVFGFCISSCSKNTVADNASPSSIEVNNVRTPETNLSSNSKNDVIFDGKNYIKKSGWIVPSQSKRHLERKRTRMMSNEEGKEVEVTTADYSYETAWTYSQDFKY